MQSHVALRCYKVKVDFEPVVVVFEPVVVVDFEPVVVVAFEPVVVVDFEPVVLVAFEPVVVVAFEPVVGPFMFSVSGSIGLVVGIVSVQSLQYLFKHAFHIAKTVQMHDL